MPKPIRGKKITAKKRRLPFAQLKQLERLQAKRVGPDKAMLQAWEGGKKRVANALVGLLPVEAKEIAKKMVEGQTKSNIGRKIFELAKSASQKRKAEKFLALLQLTHPNWNVRYEALFGLVMVGGRKTEEYLNKTLSDPSPNLRLWTVMAVGGTSSKEALPFLKKAAKDLDFVVSSTANGFIRKIEEKK